MIGSGPFKFVANERVPGSLLVYERFADYKPREDGTPVWTAGPKIAHFDRVEWRVIPDPATAAAALQNNEVDWWENPSGDLLPLLRGAGGIEVKVQDRSGLMGSLRFNHLTAPFNNPAIRRALLKVVSQQDFCQAAAGGGPTMYHVPTGIFCPGTPMATDAGLGVFAGPRDYDAAKREIASAGYQGEKVALLSATDLPILKGVADVSADMMQKVGLNVDYQAMDWGTLLQRRAKMVPVDQGGWSVYGTFWAGLDQINPVGHVFLRGLGKTGGMPGWPDAPRIEELRQQWLDAPDLAAQQRIAVQLQLQALQDVPYVPLGQVFQATAYRNSIADVLDGFVIFWNVRRA
jgi:peptide/nickel transport system substrate-binding protein